MRKFDFVTISCCAALFVALPLCAAPHGGPGGAPPKGGPGHSHHDRPHNEGVHLAAEIVGLVKNIVAPTPAPPPPPHHHPAPPPPPHHGEVPSGGGPGWHH